MNKKDADKLIHKYHKKIFGFALSKLRDYSKAEELADDIICEVYLSFLRADNIVNTDGYVYRIASNIYARYINDIKSCNYVSINDIEPHYCEDYERLENDETIKKLKQEIGYLTQRQRTIVYLFYYLKLSVAEISNKLEISVGTVKWHLSDARSSIKEEIIMDKITDNLAINPIRFTSMGHNGWSGSKGDTRDMFDTQLKQNIAFACYYTPLTAEEIARTIGVPLTYVADELKILEEYGYIDRMDNSKNPKFRTNMFITDARSNSENFVSDAEYKATAKKFCDEVYEELFADFDSDENNWGFSCNENDKNFMKYNLAMLCTRYMFDEADEDEGYQKLRVARPDGGCFIAHADVVDDSYIQKENPYWCCGYMHKSVWRNEGKNLAKIQLDCRFSNRSELRWRDDLESDWETLYDFIRSGCDVNSLSIDEYKRLCDKGYVADDKVQIMSYVSKNNENCFETIKKLISEKLNISEELKQYNIEFSQKAYEHQKANYPSHIHPIIKYYSKDLLGSGYFVVHLIEEMLERGMIKPLNDFQRKSVLTVITYN